MTIDLVIKIGGGLLADERCLSEVLRDVRALARTSRVAVVPGGGPFADLVRAVDRRVRLAPAEAHWMAILAMNQYAHLLAGRLEDSVLVQTKAQALAASSLGRTALVEPYQWLRDADPLPHSWDVTSDSIAAWIATDLGASRLLLVKPANATEPLVDDYFSRASHPLVRAVVVRAGTPLSTAFAVS